jgi:hypothetical protein
MEIQQDFRDLLALFNSHKVEYLIVGGYALGFHGAPRFTGDIDILIKPDSENAENILRALDEFGFGSLGLTAADFSTPQNVIQLGVSPVRIDILTSITGVPWEQAAGNKVGGAYGDIPVHYISINDFKDNKLAVGRAKDIADLEALNELDKN